MTDWRDSQGVGREAKPHHQHSKEHVKMRALILYLANRWANDPEFTSMKLNKALFHADFSAFARLGNSLTRYEYRALQDGPTLVALIPVLDEMASKGQIEYSKDRIKALETVDPDRVFSPDERAVIERSAERMDAMTAYEARNASHDFPGWEHAWKYGSDRKTIPYESVFWDRRKTTTPAENEHAREIAREFGLAFP